MTPDDSREAPFQTDEADQLDNGQHDEAEATSAADSAEIEAAREAWDQAESVGQSPALETEDDAELAELAQPFVGRWNQLISTTNWEKGRIISDWRAALIESGVDASQYSDEAWARRVGGVTAPHVGRLRRVHDRFASTYETYDGLYWSHFLAGLDWDDAPMWLEGASKEGWSVAGMREQRWQANGAVESNRPLPGEVVVVDTDEDVVMPALGGGRTKEYGDEPDAAAGPVYEGPDFGDEEELSALSGNAPAAPQGTSDGESEAGAAPVQPFAGLPELPDDLSDAIESLKLAVLRHKTSGWEDTDADTIQRLSLIHISEPTRPNAPSRMPSSA